MRMPVVADRFYPGNPARLEEELRAMVPAVAEEERRDAIAVVSPHAGYFYSGAVAGETFARIRPPETALILGPNHHGRGAPLALGAEDWDMPMGRVAMDRGLAEAVLAGSSVITLDESAHEHEHSLEVQVPFLQYLNPALRIVPIVVGHVHYAVCVIAARDLAAAIRAHECPVLLVASTDMTHYESRRSASKKDHMALDRLLAMDPAGLYDTVLGNRISMCGIMPTTIVLLAAMELGATRVELIRYTDSGEAGGDTSQVVGYAGLIIS